MLGDIVYALKSTVDLLLKGRQDKKARLEIEKLEHEKGDRERKIEGPTFDDVRRFDPKVNLLMREVEAAQRRSVRELPGGRRSYPVIVLAVLLAAIVALACILLLIAQGPQ